MGETENLSTYDLIKNLKDEVEKGKKDCRSEANDLLKKIFRAVEVHTDFPNVNKGLDELAVKFSDLEEKLSTMTKERDSLLDMLDNLKFENRQFHAMLSQIIQEKDKDDDQLRAAIMLLSTEMLQKTKSFSPSTMPGRYSIAKVSKIVSKSASYGDPNETGQITKESDEESTSTSEDESAKENEINDTGPGIVSSDRDVSPASNIRFVPTKNRLVKNEKVNQNYKPDVAKKSDLKDEKRPANNRENKDFQCERCSYTAARKDTLKRHVLSHASNRDAKKFECERCSFSAARKDSLKRHGISAHGDDKQFKCGYCPYLTARKDNLKKHVERKHGYGRTQRP